MITEDVRHAIRERVKRIDTELMSESRRGVYLPHEVMLHAYVSDVRELLAESDALREGCLSAYEVLESLRVSVIWELEPSVLVAVAQAADDLRAVLLTTPEP